MATNEERMRILKMVEDGKLTPEEAARMLTALSGAADRTRLLRSRVRFLRFEGQAAATFVPARRNGSASPQGLSLSGCVMISDEYCGRYTRRMFDVVLGPLRWKHTLEKQAMLPAGAMTGSPGSSP